MYRRVFPRLFAAAFSIGVLGFTAPPAAAQTASAGAQHQHPPAPQPGDDSQHQHDAAQPDMQQMGHGDMQHMMHGEASMPETREGSGTSWLPDETPMYALHAQSGGWMLMAHGSAFLQYLHEGGDRGSHQVGSVNWIMGMADRAAGGGHLGLRGMMSLEPWTIRGCGYPDLLASGEVCKGEAIHDRQHPHDLFMELAATYDRPLAGGVHLQLYGGPVGEPALGPVAFPHRLSAMQSPLAPITHHWFDATHITYGVVTGGIYSPRWKAEASVFNGREPDEQRTNVDFAALDSWSGRLWFLPTKRWALQVSAGRLTEAEAGHDGDPRLDVDRVTASATYHRLMRPGTIWASTIGWGRNHEPGGDPTNALLAETNLTLNGRDSWFGRFELSQKSGHDLALQSHDLFTVARLQAGYTRYLPPGRGLQPGLGASASAGLVPESLKPQYGSRVNVGFAVFLTIRPGEREM
jgi:hypothetical protein